MVGALEFEFVAVATVQLPRSDCLSRFPAAGLEVDLRVEGDNRVLVIDHRSAHDEMDEPARVELWRCRTRAEGEAADLLVVAGRRTDHGETEAIRVSSLPALVRALSRLSRVP